MKKNNLNNKKNESKLQVTRVQKCEPTKKAIYFKSLDVSVEPDMLDGKSPFSNFYSEFNDNADFISIVDPYAYIEQNLIAAKPLLDNSKYNRIYCNININRIVDSIMMEIDNIYCHGFYSLIKDYESMSTAYSSMIGSLFNISDLEHEIYIKIKYIMSLYIYMLLTEEIFKM